MSLSCDKIILKVAAFHDSEICPNISLTLPVKWRRRHAGFVIFIAKLVVASRGLFFPCFQRVRSLDCYSAWRARDCCIYERVFVLLGFNRSHLEWPSALISILPSSWARQCMLCFVLFSYELGICSVWPFFCVFDHDFSIPGYSDNDSGCFFL